MLTANICHTDTGTGQYGRFVVVIFYYKIFYFIGNSDSEEMKKEQEFVERTLDKLLPGHEDKTRLKEIKTFYASLVGKYVIFM